MLLAGSVSGRPHSKWWWCHDIGYPLLAAEHSLCKAPWSGTACRTTSVHSRTVSPLDSAWKPGCSLATSVLSALETLWQLRYINSHLPYHTIPYHRMQTASLCTINDFWVSLNLSEFDSTPRELGIGNDFFQLSCWKLLSLLMFFFAEKSYPWCGLSLPVCTEEVANCWTWKHWWLHRLRCILRASSQSDAELVSM